MSGFETQLNLCSHKLTTLSHHLALGEKTDATKLSQVAATSGLAGAEGSASVPFQVSVAEFYDSKKTTSDYIKVLGVGETLALLLPAIQSA